MGKLTMVGNFRPPYSTENDLLWTFRDLGHTVECLQEDDLHSNDIIQYAAETGNMFWMHTHGWEIRGNMAHALPFMRENNIRTASFSLDLFVGIDRREKDYLQHPFFHTDCFFGVDGSPLAQQHYQRNRIRHCWIKPGVVRRDVTISEAISSFSSDVAFVGSYGYHPEWPHRPRLVDWLRETYGQRFRKWGNPERTVRGLELNSLYASVKVVVGDTLCPQFSHPFYWSDRLYETIGRGGFLLMPHVQGMCDEFQDGVHLRYYEFLNWKELKRLIDYYVTHDAEREKIRIQGFQHCRANHTYNNRVGPILQHLGVA